MRRFKNDTALLLGALLMLPALPSSSVAVSGQTRSTARRADDKHARRTEAFEPAAANALDVWGAEQPARLNEIGRGVGIVFSPDLSVRTNRRFYERLGFAYFEHASWRQVVEEIKRYNFARPENRIDTLIVESHGTNGNGLKLQHSSAARAPRSYISVGALREHLGAAGVRLCVIAACNSGRLFRPRIYNVLDTRTGDPLFLPPTLGIVNTSPRFDPKLNHVRVFYPLTSRLETTNEGDTAEFSSAARASIEKLDASPAYTASDATAGATNDGIKFVVSDIFIQLLLREPRLRLVEGGHVTKRSRSNYTDEESEQMFRGFVRFVEEVAARERSGRSAG